MSSPIYRVVLTDAFLDDIRSNCRKHPDLKSQLAKKLEYLANNPLVLGRRLQASPECFKARIGSDFRVVYLVRGSCLVPLLLYAKNQYEDVQLVKLQAAIDAVTRRLAGEE